MSRCWQDYLVLLSVSNILRMKPLQSFLISCNSECQVADWKNGIPVPHKQVCGQTLGEETLDGIDSTERPAQNDAWMKPYDETLAKFNWTDQKKADFRAQLAEMTFPEPVPGFKRSMALQLQIQALHEDFDTHYMVLLTPLDLRYV